MNYPDAITPTPRGSVSGTRPSAVVIGPTDGNIIINSPGTAPLSTVGDPIPPYMSMGRSRHQPWDSQVENFIESFLQETEKGRDLHHKHAARCIKKRHIFGLPPVIITLIMAPLSQAMDPCEEGEHWLKYVITCAFVIAGMFSAIGQHFNYGKKSEKHLITEAKYEDLYTDIKEILAKRENNRGEAATVMRTIRMRYDQIGDQAPYIA